MIIFTRFKWFIQGQMVRTGLKVVSKDGINETSFLNPVLAKPES